MTNDEHFREQGAYFGYPQCCIDAFCDRYQFFMISGISPLTPDQSTAGNTGFVPCHAHAVQVVDGVITIESLIQNRVCTKPFPEEDCVCAPAPEPDTSGVRTYFDLTLDIILTVDYNQLQPGMLEVVGDTVVIRSPGLTAQVKKQMEIYDK